MGAAPVTAVGAVAMTASLGATALVDSVWIAYLTYGLGVGLGELRLYPHVRRSGRLV